MDNQILKIFHDFQLKTLTETVNFLLKLVAFYFALLAACVGYLFTVKLDPEIKTEILNGILVSSGIFSIIVVSLSWGVITGLADINKGMKAIGETEYNKMRLNHYFQRGQLVSLIVVISCVGIIGVLVITLINIMGLGLF